MPDVTVHRHGDRWAVAESGAPSPLGEFETRAEAESAARQLAAGGSVEVRDEDPTSLGADGVGRDDAPPMTGDGAPARAPLRDQQGGL